MLDGEVDRIDGLQRAEMAPDSLSVTLGTGGYL